MGITLRCSRLTVPKQLSDHRKPQGGACTRGSEAVTKVVEAHSFQTRRPRNRCPWAFQVSARLPARLLLRIGVILRLAGLAAGDDVVGAGDLWQLLQYLQRSC